MSPHKTPSTGLPATPAMPRVAVDSPVTVALKATEQAIAVGRAEYKIKAQTASRAHAAWKRTCTPSNPQGDPNLRHTMNVESVLAVRVANSQIKPHFGPYIDLLKEAVSKNLLRPDDGLKRVTDAWAEAQFMAWDDLPQLKDMDEFFGSVLARLAEPMLRRFAAQPGPETYRPLVEILASAQIRGSFQLPVFQNIQAVVARVESALSAGKAPW